ncbi:hypothetical protein GGR21_001838 [Dysgonomonas hofstadii]|uniref:Uncharacterized protein n=1 Tax=Dysgonomonas hofstadii TaxID=637886 RepID=A0A840CVV8_9BACT|nr:hypothetical protein [Dysgonomonas hofstadii]MBB4035943.1 hypothetical protein [Dysgonomonas hofstadii]
MDENRKKAYRYLLYRAIVWGKANRSTRVSLNPIEIKKDADRLKMLGALNYWLHNLAYYNYMDDWEGFKEELFWKDYEEFWLKQFPEHNYFKDIFEKELHL